MTRLSKELTNPEPCPRCGGLGLKNRQPCENCDGNGLIGLVGLYPEKESDQTTGPVTSSPAPGNGIASEYWAERIITSVHKETLNVWKSQLEEKAAALKGELGKLQGGMIQIDQELARRVEKKGHS